MCKGCVLGSKARVVSRWNNSLAVLCCIHVQATWYAACSLSMACHIKPVPTSQACLLFKQQYQLEYYSCTPWLCLQLQCRGEMSY
jgi:hypothetical protein